MFTGVHSEYNRSGKVRQSGCAQAITQYTLIKSSNNHTDSMAAVFMWNENLMFQCVLEQEPTHTQTLI